MTLQFEQPHKSSKKNAGIHVGTRALKELHVLYLCGEIRNRRSGTYSCDCSQAAKDICASGWR